MTIARSELGRIARFAAVGIVNTLTSMLVTWLGLHWGLPSRLAAYLGYGVGTVISFVANRSFTFAQPRGSAWMAQAVRFAGVSLALALLYAECLTLLLRLFPSGIAVGLSTLLVLALNYLAQRLFVFRAAR